jgi:hypothetical protein
MQDAESLPPRQAGPYLANPESRRPRQPERLIRTSRRKGAEDRLFLEDSPVRLPEPTSSRSSSHNSNRTNSNGNNEHRNSSNESEFQILMWETGVQTRERQSPDWRFAGRHSGEWRSRESREIKKCLCSATDRMSV